MAPTLSNLAQVHARESVFYVNGKQARAIAPELSLNEYIRQHTPYKGTKLACGEGGCGACAVQVTSYDPATDSTQTSSINSCLCPVGTLDGVAITTAEGLGNSRSGFSSVQEKFASHHASQCGFCTPGFVVACHATLAKCSEAGEQPTPEKMMQGLDGNLCRCTGYTPILDACKSLVVDMEDICNGGPKQADFPEELKQYNKEKHTHQSKKPAAVVKREDNSSSSQQQWVSPTTLAEVFSQLEANKATGAMILAGNTAAGVYHEWPEAPVIINIKGVRELSCKIDRNKGGLTVGAAVPFAEVICELEKAVEGKPSPAAWQSMAAHLKRIAGSHVRWAATPGGNLALTRDTQHYLESDFATVLMGAGGEVQVTNKQKSRWMSVEDFLKPDAGMQLGKTDLITAVSFPAISPGERFWSHKVALRFYNSHALVNMAVWTKASSSGNGITDARIAVGCPTLFRESSGCEATVAWQLRRAHHAEAALKDDQLDARTLLAALEGLQQDICPGTTVDASAEYYRSTAEGLLFQALAPLLPEAAKRNVTLQRLLSAESLPPPGVPAGREKFQPPPTENLPVGLPVEKDRIRLQASGEAVYSSDVGVGGGQLYAAVVPSTEVLAMIDNIDASEALKVPGVVAFVGADDVPGENKVDLCGGDAEIFASKKVEYVYQPLGIMVAETPQLAKKAAGLVKVEYSHPKELGEPILTIEGAIKAESFFEVPDGAGGQVHRGDVTKAMAAAKHVIKNAKYTLPSQQHFYMETQVAVAEPQEGGTFLVHSSTQTIDGVQAAVARALNTPAHDIVVVCRRAGGGFGGKVARSLPVAAAAAVAAHKTQQTVHYQLSRNDDFRMNGGRSETELEYDVAFDDEGRVSALAVRGWFLAGADQDLAFNDMMILQVGADQVYDIPNIDLDLKVVRTNLPPRTIMRGPGFLNAVMVIEQVMEHVSTYLGADRAATRQLNFLKAPEDMPLPLPQKAGYTFKEEQTALEALSAMARDAHQRVKDSLAGICARALPTTAEEAASHAADPAMMKTTLSRPFKVESWTLPRIWEGLIKMADYENRRDAVEQFNKDNAWRKRGISINPCRFDCAPQPIVAAVSIYYDGSILVTHGGLEVGQGLSTKVKQMTVYELSKLLPEKLRPLPLELVRINDTRSDIVPNAGPTWSSTGSEATCAAVQEACKQLRDSLAAAAEDVKADSGAAFWRAAVSKVNGAPIYGPASVQLSAVGFFDGTERTPGGAGKEAMSYSSFGAAITEVELDVLTGEKIVLRSDIHYDCGQSLNPAIDMGQVEGAFIQGLGYLTSEEVVYDKETGHLITDGTWKYKPPSAACIPQQMFVAFLKDSPNPKGIMSSKASGEPTLLLSTSILYALLHALLAARSELQASEQPVNGLSPKKVAEGNDLSGNDLSGNDFFVLAAPATTIKLKQACGGFSVASLIKSAIERQGSTDSEGWTVLQAGK